MTTDHRDVHRLFEDYKDLVDSEADGSERQALAEQICTMLTAHATCEEEIFYPAAREALDEDDLLDEAEVEHASATDLIAQIQSMQPDDDLYDAKVTVLGEYVDHHVDEEEGEMFPKCRKAGMDLKALGERLAARKQQLLAQDEMSRRRRPRSWAAAISSYSATNVIEGRPRTGLRPAPVRRVRRRSR